MTIAKQGQTTKYAFAQLLKKGKWQLRHRVERGAKKCIREEEVQVSDQATNIGCSKARGGALAHDLAVQASLYKGPCPPPLHWHVLASVLGT